MAETGKAKNRRLRDGFFDKYINYVPQATGIDIGCGRLDTHDGNDPITKEAVTWDKDNGDATFMAGVPDNFFSWVYSSHCLEHISNPYLAIKNWFRILKPLGYLIIFVPHRNLYEKRKELPSQWNPDHKFFLLPDKEELPYTLNFRELIIDSLSGTDFLFEYIKTCDEGYQANGKDHAGGEYSIEAVIKKLP